MSKTSIPVIVPFKEVSKRFSNKNFILFSYTYAWLKKTGLASDMHVVTKSAVVKNFIASCYSGVDVIDEQESHGGDDITAACCAAKTLGASWYF